ncbi:MAG: hypothetical protein AAF063_23175, partial [Cyanobacteria bacterium J06643_5]
AHVTKLLLDFLSRNKELVIAEIAVLGSHCVGRVTRLEASGVVSPKSKFPRQVIVNYYLSK